jgi:hypothetical protein
MRRFVSPAVAIAAVALLALPVEAHSAAHGALAYDGEGAYGSSNDYSSDEEARANALAECKKYSSKGSCSVVASFKSQCAALADTREGDGHLGWAAKSSLTDALIEALASCNAKAGQYHCGIIVWTCPEP